MSEPQSSTASPSFGTVADAYDRGRPGYPAEAVRWLLGHEPQIVLELGAGTGKLTAELVRQGHAVHATDPDPQMLALLEANVPDASCKRASAEYIPANDRSVDVVVVGQAFQWFNAERALAEIARILRPGGHLAIVHNEHDVRIPWVRRFGALLGDAEQDFFPESVVTHERFGFVDEASFKHWHDVNRETVLDLALSHPKVLAMDHGARESKLTEVLAFYDDYGRGMDGMQLPWIARCFKASLVDRPGSAADDQPKEGDGDGESSLASDGTDSGMLLIDFT